MDTQSEQSQNHKQKYPWKLIHPKNENTHATLLTTINFHLAYSKRKIIKYFQALDIFFIFLLYNLFFGGPFLIAKLLKKNNLSYIELNCLLLTGYYKRHHGDTIENFSNRQ